MTVYDKDDCNNFQILRRKIAIAGGHPFAGGKSGPTAATDRGQLSGSEQCNRDVHASRVSGERLI